MPAAIAPAAPTSGSVEIAPAQYSTANGWWPQRSSRLLPISHKNSRLPIRCSQPPWMNDDVSAVIGDACAGTTAYWCANVAASSWSRRAVISSQRCGWARHSTLAFSAASCASNADGPTLVSCTCTTKQIAHTLIVNPGSRRTDWSLPRGTRRNIESAYYGVRVVSESTACTGGAAPASRCLIAPSTSRWLSSIDLPANTVETTPIV